MNRGQLEHVIRAAAAIAEDDEIWVVGSQSILGAIPDPPAELAVSMEADVAPRNRPEREALIAGSIGELSPFHTTFGYYADGVDIEGVRLPDGWRDRVVLIDNQNTRPARGLCLEPHDCAVSKLFAGREKDRLFVAGLLRHRLVDPELLGSRIGEVPGDAEETRLAAARLDRLLRA